jgi:response regulator NasT
METTPPLRIAVAEDLDEDRYALVRHLSAAGHQVTAVATGQELVELCRASAPDLVITDVKMPDMDGIEAAEAIARERPVPIILVSAYHEQDLLRRAGRDGHVMAYLLKPAGPAQLKATIHLARQRFAHFQAVAEEAGSLRQALADRKVVERGKGAVMRRLRVDEQEAFRRMKSLASAGNRKLIEVAREVLAAEEVFRQIDEVPG